MRLSFHCQLQAQDTGANSDLFSISGSLGPGAQTVYESQTNSVTLEFVTDSSTAMDGWRVRWREVVPTTTTSTTTSTTTTPPGTCVLASYICARF